VIVISVAEPKPPFFGLSRSRFEGAAPALDRWWSGSRRWKIISFYLPEEWISVIRLGRTDINCIRFSMKPDILQNQYQVHPNYPVFRSSEVLCGSGSRIPKMSERIQGGWPTVKCATKIGKSKKKFKIVKDQPGSDFARNLASRISTLLVGKNQYFFTSWIRIRICPCESGFGSGRPPIIRIH